MQIGLVWSEGFPAVAGRGLTIAREALQRKGRGGIRHLSEIDTATLNQEARRLGIPAITLAEEVLSCYCVRMREEDGPAARRMLEARGARESWKQRRNGRWPKVDDTAGGEDEDRYALRLPTKPVHDE